MFFFLNLLFSIKFVCFLVFKLVFSKNIFFAGHGFVKPRIVALQKKGVHPFSTQGLILAFSLQQRLLSRQQYHFSIWGLIYCFDYSGTKGTSQGFKKVVILALKKKLELLWEHHFSIQGSIYNIDCNGTNRRQLGFQKRINFSLVKKGCYWQHHFPIRGLFLVFQLQKYEFYGQSSHFKYVIKLYNVL